MSIGQSGQFFRPPLSRTVRRSADFAEIADEGCARLAQRGSGAALAELVRRHTPGIYHLFVRLFSDREMASDATQEVFLRAHRHLGRFKPDRNFRKWLYTIAWNFARDYFRRRSRRGDGKVVSLDSFRSASGAGNRDFEPEDERSPRPEDVVESKDQVLWVRRALDRLPPAQRAMLILREYEGFSYEEIAELIGCKVGTVKSRLNRARLGLKETLLELRPGWLEERTFGGI